VIRRYSNALQTLIALSDAAVAVLIFVLVAEIRFGPSWNTALDTQIRTTYPILIVAVFAVAWVALLWLHGLYQLRTSWTLASEIRAVVKATIWLAGCTSLILFLGRLDFSRAVILAVFPVLAAATIAARALLRRTFRLLRQAGRNARYVLVLGTGAPAQEFAALLLRHGELGLRIAGFVGEEPAQPLPNGWVYWGTLEALPEVIHARVIDEVAICLPVEDWSHVSAMARLCEDEGKIVRVPMMLPYGPGKSQLEELDGLPILSVMNAPYAIVALTTKRLIDVTLAAVAIIALSPLMLALAITVGISDGRPILFRQERVGLQGRRFTLVKFRTMVKDAETQRAILIQQNEVNGHAFKLTFDPRVTRVGRFLRRSSLDELPQLFNVFVGDMSLVGPRPPLPREVADYDVWHRRRLSMKPGITGLWQIEGRRDPEFDRWVEKDLEYIDNWSPWLDLRIMAMTIPALLRSEGR